VPARGSQPRRVSPARPGEGPARHAHRHRARGSVQHADDGRGQLRARLRATAILALVVTALIAAGAALVWTLWRGQVDNTTRYEGKTAADWIAASRDRDPAIRAQAAYALTQVTFSTPAECRVALIVEGRFLSDAEDDVRREAVDGLIDFAQRGEDGARVVVMVTGVLRTSTRPDTRVAAVRVLGALGHAAKSAEPEIADLLLSPSADIRGAAVTALADVGADDSGTVSALARVVGDHDSAVREAALSALMQLGAKASTVLPVAIPAVTDTAPAVREQAAYTIGALQPVPQAAIAPLARMLWDPIRGARLAAAEALERALPARAARDALERAARDADSTVRAPAHAALVASAASQAASP
jgi:HEAT repeat protein